MTRRALLAAGGAALAFRPVGTHDASARTSTAEPGLHFLAVGDWGDMGSAGQRSVANAMASDARVDVPGFIISLGDNFYPGGVASTEDPEWRTAFESVYSDPALMCPWYAILGNHDLLGNAEAEITYTRRDPRWHMPGRYYKIARNLPDGSLAEFFLLDTNVFAERTYFDHDAANAQLFWLHGALSASAARWKIVAGHHPVFSGGYHGSSKMLVRFLKPVLDRNGVAAYLSGHDHDMQHIRVDGIHYLICGAGSEHRPTGQIPGTLFAKSALGFLSASVNSAEIDGAFIGVDGVPLHQFRIAQRG